MLAAALYTGKRDAQEPGPSSTCVIAARPISKNILIYADRHTFAAYAFAKINLKQWSTCFSSVLGDSSHRRNTETPFEEFSALSRVACVISKRLLKKKMLIGMTCEQSEPITSYG
jgi:hypothetical protein